MSEIKILSVKLIDGGASAIINTKERNKVESSGPRTYPEAVHPDFVDAVQALAPHLAILCDFIPEKKVNDVKEMEKFTIYGYSLGTKEGNEGVTITGGRLTKSGQKFTINTPYTRFEQDEANGYQLIGDLQSKLEAINIEVLAYLNDGKKLAPKLEFPEDGPVTNMQIAESLTEDPTGMNGEEKEFTPGDYKKEVDKTTELRDQGKVIPIKKGKGKKVAEPVEEKEYTRQELIDRAEKKGAGKKNPNKTPKTNHLGQELSDNVLPVSAADIKKAQGKK